MGTHGRDSCDICDNYGCKHTAEEWAAYRAIEAAEDEARRRNAHVTVGDLEAFEFRMKEWILKKIGGG